MLRGLRRRAATLTFVIALGSGCGGSDVPINATPEDLLTAAQNKLANEDWFEAAELLEHSLRSHPGSSLAPLAKLRLGDARFGLDEYVAARGHYEDVVEDFPASEFVEEARWGIARCSYAQMRPYDRDPTETERALRLLEELKSDYPASRFTPQIDAAIADCRDRLARREFEAGHFYVRQHRPRSAKIQFQYVLDTYPDTGWARKACLEIGEIYRLRGKSEEAERYFRRVLSDWPDTEESTRAQQSLQLLAGSGHPGSES